MADSSGALSGVATEGTCEELGSEESRDGPSRPLPSSQSMLRRWLSSSKASPVSAALPVKLQPETAGTAGGPPHALPPPPARLPLYPALTALLYENAPGGSAQASVPPRSRSELEAPCVVLVGVPAGVPQGVGTLLVEALVLAAQGSASSGCMLANMPNAVQKTASTSCGCCARVSAKSSTITVVASIGTPLSTARANTCAHRRAGGLRVCTGSCAVIRARALLPVARVGRRVSTTRHACSLPVARLGRRPRGRGGRDAPRLRAATARPCIARR